MREPPAPDAAELEAVLDAAYAALNARDIDATLALMDPAVVWPITGNGRSVHGQVGLRAHWTRQWQSTDTCVEPREFLARQDGSMVVSVREITRDRDGLVVSESHVSHVYSFRDGLIATMRIAEE
jgi:hypothetical protein